MFVKNIKNIIYILKVLVLTREINAQLTDSEIVDKWNTTVHQVCFMCIRDFSRKLNTKYQENKKLNTKYFIHFYFCNFNYITCIYKVVML